MSERLMTCVFACDVRSFDGNPHHADTPFGQPLVVSDGDLAGEFDRMEAKAAKVEADNARLTADLAAKDVALRKMLAITQGMIKGYISPYKLEEAEAAAQSALTGRPPKDQS